jgi:hypothetical protein
LMVTVEIIVRSKQHQKLLIKLGITTHRKWPCSDKHGTNHVDPKGEMHHLVLTCTTTSHTCKKLTHTPCVCCRHDKVNHNHLKGIVTKATSQYQVHHPILFIERQSKTSPSTNIAQEHICVPENHHKLEHHQSKMHGYIK